MENKDSHHYGNWIDSNGGIHAVSYNKKWNGHAFSPEEHRLLLEGKEISFTENGKLYEGHLQYRVHNGNEYFGFCPNYDRNYDKHPVYKQLVVNAGSFQQDLATQDIISDYLTKHLYSAWKNDDGTKVDFFRFNHKALQDREVDIVIRYNNKEYLIEEKAQSDYIYKDKPLGTFAFELSFLNKNGEIADGWFVKDNLLTEYFMLGWPHADKKPLNVEAIEYVDCALVDKHKLLMMIESKFHSDTNQLKAYAQMMREGKLTCTSKKDINGKITHYYYKTDCFDSSGYLVFTLTKSEKPINFVLKRDLIDECTILKGRVERKEI